MFSNCDRLTESHMSTDWPTPSPHVSIADGYSGQITEQEQARGVDVAEANGNKGTSNLEWGS